MHMVLTIVITLVFVQCQFAVVASIYMPLDELAGILCVGACQRTGNQLCSQSEDSIIFSGQYLKKIQKKGGHNLTPVQEQTKVHA